MIWILIAYLTGRQRGQERAINAFNEGLVRGIARSREQRPTYMNRPGGAGVVDIRNPR